MNDIKQMYDRWAAGDMGRDDQWGDVTAEPRGLDYLEISADGVPAMWLAPHGADPDRVIVAYHGGGFVGGSLWTHRKMYGHLAKAAGVRVLLATYRLAPEFPYPAQIDDAVTACRWVRDQGIAHIALAGDSSGGGLAVHTALRVAQIKALLLMSPWLDMDPKLSAATFDTKAGTDVFFTRAMVRGLLDVYLPADVDPTDPAVNALHADLRGLPPILIQVGADESGLGDSERLAALLPAPGPTDGAENPGPAGATLEVFPGQLHTFQMAAGREAVADEAIGRMAAWARPKLGL